MPNESRQNDLAAAAHNRRAWDQRVRDGGRFAVPVGDDALIEPMAKLDAAGWLGGSIEGQRVLCLAAGGGRQGPMYAAAGAEVTVVDISSAMLDIDVAVAKEKNLQLRVLETSMDDLSELGDGVFDLVIHPVSTCYLPSVDKVFAEVARVMRAGGIYISQHKQPTSLQAAPEASDRGLSLREPYYREGPLPPAPPCRHREEGTLEFLHRLEEIIGGICRAGFHIEDLVEPFHADPRTPSEGGTAFARRSHYAAPYMRIKAVRSSSEPPKRTSQLWTPE